MIPINIIINNNGVKYFEYLSEKFLKNRGSKKNKNNENLCKYPPAINSSPKGPPNLLP